MDFPFGGSFAAFPPPGLIPGSFSNAEISSPLLHNQHMWPMEYKTDDFRMFHLKVGRCERRESHNWKECPFQHVSENARRRDPRRIEYTTEACPMYHHGICLFGEECPFSHGVHEQLLHPAKFRTALCRKQPGGCDREVCFFAHTAAELRQPTCEPTEATRLRASHLLYSWELWHRSGHYPNGCAAFAFAASAAAAGFRAQRPEASPGGKPGPGGHTTARMRAGIGYSPAEQMYLAEISGAMSMFCDGFNVENGDWPPAPRMANDLAVALGLKHVDMGRGTWLRRSPPGSGLSSPMYRPDTVTLPFGGGSGGRGEGAAAGGGFSGNSRPTTAFGGSPFDGSPSAALATLQQQTLLQSAALAAAASRPVSRTPSGALSLAHSASGPLPDHVGPSATQPKRRSRSDAESEQACAPFASMGEVPAGLPRQQAAHMGSGCGGSSIAKLGIKGGSGRRSIDITVNASPQVLAPPAPLADLSNLRDQLHFGLNTSFPGSLPPGPFAFGAPQQLQPGHVHPAAGLMTAAMAAPAATSVAPGTGPRVQPLPNGEIVSPFELARTSAALSLRLNPSAPAFDPATLAAAAAATSCAYPARGGRLSDPQRQHRAWGTVDSDAGVRAAVTAALATANHRSAAPPTAASAASCRQGGWDPAGDDLALSFGQMAVGHI